MLVDDTDPGTLRAGESLCALEDSGPVGFVPPGPAKNKVPEKNNDVPVASPPTHPDRTDLLTIEESGPGTATQARNLMDSLRRDDSVIAEAMSLRRGPVHQVARVLQTIGKRTHLLVTEDLPAKARLLTHPGRRARLRAQWMGKYDGLPRATRRMIVALPYGIALAVGLAAVAIALRDPQPPIDLAVAPVIAADTLQPAEVAPAKVDAPAEHTLDLAAAPAAVVATEIAPPTSSSDARTIASTTHTLPIISFLRAKPDVKSRRIATLKPGTEVTVYPDFPAPDGWLLATQPEGTVGYMVALNLEGKRDQRFMKAKKKRSQKSKRRRPRGGLVTMPQ